MTLRLQVDDECGTAVIYHDTAVPEAMRGALLEVVAPLTAGERVYLLARLIRQAADENAYQRVCAERGLLL